METASKYERQSALPNERYTPEHVLAAARQAMGGAFDLDPASCPEANALVQAERIYTARDDGLAQPWAARRRWLNPPYSGVDLKVWVRKTVAATSSGAVKQVCLLIHAATETRYGQMALDHCDAVCFLNRRLRFWGPNESKGGAQIGQMVLYYGRWPSRFANAFYDLGITIGREV